MSRNPISGKEELVPEALILGDDVAALTVSDLFGSTLEFAKFDLAYTGDRAYLSGTNVTFSGDRGSSMIKLIGTLSMASGGFHGIYINLATSGVFDTNGEGIVGVKCVVVNSAALTDGEMYAAQFIAKHASTGTMLAAASLIGLEAWVYISSSGPARTCIGANLGFHNECSGAYGAGSVIRGIQIFCDNASGAQVPVESTGLCIWNQAGAITNAINVVNSGSGFTYFVAFTDDGAPSSLTNGTDLADISGTSNAGWIKCLVGSTVRYIALYAVKAS